MNIAIVDDKDILRERIADIVNGEISDSVILQYPSGESFLEDYVHQKKLQVAPFDLVTMDYSMPGGKTGVETIREMRKRGYDDRILMFSTHDLSYLKNDNYLGINKILFKDDTDGFISFLQSLK